MRILVHKRAAGGLCVYRLNSILSFVHGAPIISRYTHISKTEGGSQWNTAALQPVRDRRSGIRNILSVLINVNAIVSEFDEEFSSEALSLSRKKKKNFRHKKKEEKIPFVRFPFLWTEGRRFEEIWRKLRGRDAEGESGDERDQRDSSWKKRLDPAVIEAVCGKFEGPRDETLGNHLWRGGVSRGVRTLRATDCRGTRIIEFPPVDRKSRRVSPRDRRTEAERETVRPTPTCRAPK